MVTEASSGLVETSAVSAFPPLFHAMGVTHVVTIPDNLSAPILAALGSDRSSEEERGSGTIRVLKATREGEAIALASGLWLGGADPIVLIQNTGLLESGDGLRGTASRMGVPLLLLITCRGYSKVRAQGIDPGSVDLDRDGLVRSEVDSVALMTEQTLRAWGIPTLSLVDATDLSPVREGWERAHREERPVAVLLDTAFT
jgi:sulfopyruvate decarboxylase subunit alpha